MVIQPVQTLKVETQVLNWLYTKPMKETRGVCQSHVFSTVIQLPQTDSNY